VKQHLLIWCRYVCTTYLLHAGGPYLCAAVIVGMLASFRPLLRAAASHGPTVQVLYDGWMPLASALLFGQSRHKAFFTFSLGMVSGFIMKIDVPGYTTILIPVLNGVGGALSGLFGYCRYTRC
jgi:hypothetical protein